MVFGHFREQGLENIKKCVKNRAARRFFSETYNYDENLTMLVKILNVLLLTIIAKNSISNIAVVLDTSLEQVHWLLYCRHDLPSSIPMDSATFVHAFFLSFLWNSSFDMSYKTGSFLTFSARSSSFKKVLFWFMFYDLHLIKYILHITYVPRCLFTWPL